VFVISEKNRMKTTAYLLEFYKNPARSFALAAALSVFASGCATVGEDFPVGRVMEVQIGKTTINDIQAIFGPPFRVGSESGVKTWSYNKYHYSLFGPASTQDLVVRFDNAGIVKGYTFNTTPNK
jgi:hypothetical protein